MHEAMKTITLREETYHSLLVLKEGDDSFSDVIDRLVSRKNRDIREYAGALRDSKVLDDLQVFTKKMRSSGRARI
jgi:predicted CopG family antitoxin